MQGKKFNFFLNLNSASIELQICVVFYLKLPIKNHFLLLKGMAATLRYVIFADTQIVCPS